jgi:hypothetical protein
MHAVGFGPGAPGAPPDRWDQPHSRSSFEGPLASTFGPETSSGVRRYSFQTLEQIKHQAISMHGGSLPPPPSVAQVAVDYPEILPGRMGNGCTDFLMNLVLKAELGPVDTFLSCM